MWAAENITSEQQSGSRRTGLMWTTISTCMELSCWNTYAEAHMLIWSDAELGKAALSRR